MKIINSNNLENEILEAIHRERENLNLSEDNLEKLMQIRWVYQN